MAVAEAFVTAKPCSHLVYCMLRTTMSKLLTNQLRMYIKRSMNILGFPLQFARPQLPSFGFADASADPDVQFWYWRGASGRKYIHSVYAPDDCPPLPGAVYVAVAREGTNRHVLAVGRFSNVLDKPHVVANRLQLLRLGATEIHVHLLAKSLEQAEFVEKDLSLALVMAEQAANAA